MLKLLFLLLGIPIIILSVGLFFFKDHVWSELLVLSTPKCGSGPVLSELPTADSDFDYLIPLGNLSPFHHTIPTDHIYYVFKRENPESTVPEVDVHSPGKVRFNEILHITDIRDGQIITDDYKVSFYPCRGVTLYYDHITGFKGGLADEVKGKKEKCTESHPRPEDTILYCRVSIDYLAEPGEVIGTAGRKIATGFDFGATDHRMSPLSYANPKRYRKDAFYVACPFDLYPEDVKARIWPRFGYPDNPRTIEPVCGSVAQDKPGTLQGNWFIGDIPADETESWNKGLALVHDNLDPTVGVVSFGGNGGPVARILFEPKTVGLINREFSDITPDSKTYCYQIDLTMDGLHSPPPTEKFLIRLDSFLELSFEVQKGACTEPFNFSSPTKYSR